MNKELSTSEVAARYEVAAKTVRDWCARGLFANAYEQQTARGPVWAIPEADLENFTPPKLGRPRTRIVAPEHPAEIAA